MILGLVDEPGLAVCEMTLRLAVYGITFENSCLCNDFETRCLWKDARISQLFVERL